MKRFPSYTDRILFESVHALPQQNPVMNIYYGRVDFDLSDHKPITGLFEAKIKVIDQAARAALIDEVRNEYLADFEEAEGSRKTDFLSSFHSKGGIQECLDFGARNAASRGSDPDGLLDPVEQQKSMKRRSQSLKTLTPNTVDVDDVPDLGSLKFEDYDLGLINEHQRQLRNLVDYEKLNYKPMKIDRKKLEAALQKDSVKDVEAKKIVHHEEEHKGQEDPAEEFFTVVAEHFEDGEEEEEEKYEDQEAEQLEPIRDFSEPIERPEINFEDD